MRRPCPCRRRLAGSSWRRIGHVGAYECASRLTVGDRASDWPHPTEKADAKPDDAVLFDLLADWAPDETIRNRILVDNPVALYGFG